MSIDGEERPTDVGRIRLVALDMDGTIYRGKRLFDATIASLDRLRRQGIGSVRLLHELAKAGQCRKPAHFRGWVERRRLVQRSNALYNCGIARRAGFKMTKENLRCMLQH